MTAKPTLTPREHEIVRQVLAPFAGKIDSAEVFGSRAQGKSRPASDIDLVLHGDLIDAEIARIRTAFDESALAVTVDVIHYETLDYLPLKQHIDLVAVPLFTRQDLLAA